MRGTHRLRKITSPVLPPGILRRVNPLTRLQEAIQGPAAGFPHYKLVVLHASAGYGKTTLLADFSRMATLLCCWYFLDQSDNDALVFLETLLASIQQQFPGFGQDVENMLALLKNVQALSQQDLQACIHAFHHAIENEISERFAIFLCNYQAIHKSQVVNGLIESFLFTLPENCVMVIESRSLLHIETALLLAKREMTTLGMNVLRFTSQELQVLAQGHPAAIHAERLVQLFDGWIAGILLGTHMSEDVLLCERGTTHALQYSSDQGTIQVKKRYLLSYIVNEIFQDHFASYCFLHLVSLLEEMTPAICNRLLDIDHAAQILQELEHHSLFVISRYDEKEVLYLCHPLIRDIFSEELREHLPDTFVRLHQRAANIFRSEHIYERALFHAFKAGDNTFAAELVIDAYEQMLIQGHIERLAGWIDTITFSTVMKYPRLLLVRATIYLMVGDHVNALPLLEKLEHNEDIVALEDFPMLQAEATILRSKVLFQRGEYQQVQALCLQIQQSLPADEVKLRAEVHARLGICANLLGNFHDGITNLQKALLLRGRHTTDRQAAEVHSALASAYSLIGNFALADHHIARSITCWEQMHDERGKINNIIRMGLIKQRQGAFLEAEEAFTQALNLARGPLHFQREQAYALVNLGELFQDQGLYERSLAVTEDGLTLARQVKDKLLTNCALCILALTYLYMGDAATALLLVSEVEFEDKKDENLGYERAVHELALDTILLYQHRYDEVFKRFSTIEKSLHVMGLKREQIYMLLRVSSGLLDQGREKDWLQRMQEIANLLDVQNGYGHLALVELRRLPKLHEAVKTRPELAHLRELLHLTDSSQGLGNSANAQTFPLPVPLVESKSSTLEIVPAAPLLEIRGLGEPEVSVKQGVVTRWRMARSMELFFFLLDSGRPMRKEQIITALWSEVDEQINQTFHSTVYYLRKALGAPCVVSQGSIYSLDLVPYFGDTFWYDVTTFLRHHANASEALSQDADDSAKEELLRMIDLYRGDYVQPFYNDWCNFRREELRLAYLDARRHLARIAWREEQINESIIHWQHMLAVDNCLEEAHYGLMRCYTRQGKRSLALRQYRRCCDILQNEMAIQPSLVIQQFYQRLVGTSP